MAEVPQDTTRTVISLLFSGALTRFKNIRFIFCHAGGSLPMLAGRITQYGSKDSLAKLPDGVDYELRRQYYGYSCRRPQTRDSGAHELRSDEFKFCLVAIFLTARSAKPPTRCRGWAGLIAKCAPSVVRTRSRFCQV